MENIVDAIKQHIKKSIDEEYTEYKIKCLEELERKIEANRTRVVSDVLNTIDVSIQDRQPHSLEPIIMIRVEKKIVMGE